jgi:heavy metal sensor kinase
MAMFNSVRIRLTLWYTAVLTAVLLLLATAVYFVFKQNAIRRTDASAIEQADSFLKTVDAEMSDPSGPESLESSVEAAIAEHRFRDTMFFVIDQSGSLLASSNETSSLLNQTRATNETGLAALRRIGSNGRTFQTVRFGRARFRGYFRAFSVERKECKLIVLQSLHPQEEFLETLTSAFFLIIPLAVLLAASGGYFLARRSLAPVAAMGMQAGHIGADNLHERLQIQHPADELGQLAQSFNALLDRLDLAFEQQRRFVADASHELRTPVAILYGESEVTLSQPERTPQEYRESLSILRAESRRLKHIVEDLFTLARADSGQLPLALSAFYLDELAAECIHNARTLASAKKISLNCSAEKDLLVRADEALVRRMILNLIDNAIKYTPPGGEVHVACENREPNVVVTVSDSGEGIPLELQSRVFERFFRVDEARSRTENGGAGLGLSISRWIAEAHGGSLQLTGSIPGSTVFTVALPKTPS